MTNKQKDNLTKTQVLPGALFDIQIPEEEIPVDNDYGAYALWLVLEVREDGWCHCVPLDGGPVIFYGETSLYHRLIRRALHFLESTECIVRLIGATMIHRTILQRATYAGSINYRTVAKVLCAATNDHLVFPELTGSEGEQVHLATFYDTEEEILHDLHCEMARIDEYCERHAPRMKPNVIVAPSVIEALDAGELSDEEAAQVRWELDIN